MGKPRGPHDTEFRGTVDKTIVIRQNKIFGTIWSAYPDMSNIKPTEAQKEKRMSFGKAQKYAKEFLSNPEHKAFYKSLCKPGQRPHNVLISELLKGITSFPAEENKDIEGQS